MLSRAMFVVFEKDPTHTSIATGDIGKGAAGLWVTRVRGTCCKKTAIIFESIVSYLKFHYYAKRLNINT